MSVYRLYKPRFRGPGRFRLFSPRGNLAPLPPIPYLVSGLIPNGSLVLLQGLGSSFKSWLALWLGIGVASGSQWLDRNCDGGEVTFLDWESSETALASRVQRLIGGMSLAKARDQFTICSRADSYLDAEGFLERLEQLASTRKLIIIDSLRASTPGTDENDSRIRRLLDAVSAIAVRTRCAIVIIHHAKKGGQNSDPRERGRGSSAIFDAADVVLLLDSRRGTVRVVNTKARDARQMDPVGISLEDVKGNVVMRTVPLAKDGGPSPKVAALVLEHLKGEPGLTKNKLSERVGGNARAFRLAFDSLKAEGKIKPSDSNPIRWFAIDVAAAAVRKRRVTSRSAGSES
jgi:AAA domain